jgi:chromate transporter
MSLFALFCTFAYVGVCTIGGGLVAISIMYKPIVEGGLISPEMFYNMVAISESTPGPIGINMATYVGYKLYGIPGAVLCTLGEVLPSLIIVVIIARWFMSFHEKPLVSAIFTGIRPAVTGMIAVACLQVLQLGVIRPGLSGNYTTALFYVAALAALLKTNVHPILVVAAGALFGAVCL